MVSSWNRYGPETPIITDFSHWEPENIWTHLQNQHEATRQGWTGCAFVWRTESFTGLYFMPYSITNLWEQDFVGSFCLPVPKCLRRSCNCSMAFGIWRREKRGENQAASTVGNFMPGPTEVNVIAYGLLASACNRAYHWTQALQAALLSLISMKHRHSEFWNSK